MSTEPTMTFKTKKRLTLPAIKFVVGKTQYVKIMGPIHEGKQRGKVQTDADGKPKKPPMLCDVIDLTSGEHVAMICAEIIKTELAESYPNDAYVGLGFAITKQTRKEGKRYDPYNIEEIELPEQYASAPAAVETLPAAKKRA